MRVYVCTATGQNTINLIPLLENGQYNVKTIDKIIVIKTIGKKTNIWFENLMTALKIIKNEHTHLELSELPVSDFRSVGINIIPLLKSDDHVIFNIGGGIKSLALNILLFAKSIEGSNKWEVIYPSFEEKALIVFLPSYNKIRGLSAKINNELVLSLYGHEAQSSSSKFDENLPLKLSDDHFRELYYYVLNLGHSYMDDDYKKGLLPFLNKILQICLAQSTIEISSTLKENSNQRLESIIQAKKNITTRFPDLAPKEVQSLLPKKVGAPSVVPIIEKTLSPNNIKNVISQIKHYELNLDEKYAAYNIDVSPQDYFEFYATKMIKDYLEVKYANYYVSVETNYIVISKSTKRTEAQHDLLLTLNNGQLISFDAKTMVNDHQKILSRIKSLENVAGVYTSFICVIPFYWSDFTIDSIKSNKYLNNLLELPFYFKNHNIVFCVISNENEPYSLTRSGNGIEKEMFSEDHFESNDYVPIIPYTKFIDKLF